MCAGNSPKPSAIIKSFLKERNFIVKPTQKLEKEIEARESQESVLELILYNVYAHGIPHSILAIFANKPHSKSHRQITRYIQQIINNINGRLSA